MENGLIGALLAAVAFAFSGAALAQGEGPRGSVPPGMSQDGSAPAEGAIKGGTILPGERGGVPADVAAQRCKDLRGVLRDQCLRELDSASGGASRGAQPEVPGVVEREPKNAPPPHNPR